jgi:hypothetical protein
MLLSMLKKIKDVVDPYINDPVILASYMGFDIATN